MERGREYRMHVHESHQETEGIVEIQSQLENIVSDRARFGLDHGGRVKGIEFVPPPLQEFDVATGETIRKNIALLEMLNGHRGAALRSLLLQGDSPAVGHLRDLFAWSEESVHSGILTYDAILKNEVPATLLQVTSPEELYEFIQFEKHSPEVGGDYKGALLSTIAGELGVDSTEVRWIDLIDPLFSDQSGEALERILRSVGFIPSELYTKKAFRGLGSEKIVRALDVLRGLEQTDLMEVARYERARLTNEFIVSGNANELRTQGKKHMVLDASGVRIDLKTFHGHIPYGLVSDRFLGIAEKDQWIKGESERTELGLRRAEENSERKEVHKLQEEQLRMAARALGIEGSIEEISVRFTEQIIANPDRVAKELEQAKMIVPDLVVDSVIALHEALGVYSLARMAEAVGAEVTGERLTRRPKLFATYDVMREQDEAYKARASVLHQSTYYNAVKVSQILLQHPIVTKPEAHMLVFKGRYARSEGDQHAFLEVVRQGRVARVLLNEDRHIRQPQRETWENLPSFDRAEYEQLENALRAFDYFTVTITNLETVLREKKKKWEQRFADLAETAIAFLLMNQTADYLRAQTLFSGMRLDAQDANGGDELLSILHEAHTKYADFLYLNAQNAERFKERFVPEIQKQEMEFGGAFLEDVEKTCSGYGPEALGYDRELSLEASPVRVVTLNYKSEDPTRTIPYQVEESALEALRINRQRPLINIIGGCKDVEGMQSAEEHPLNRMSIAVLRVAHESRANVGIPGTQSGIGVFFGRQAVHYRNNFGHLPKAEQAHVFAVSPGGNTHYPGSPYSHQAVNEERFAMAPVDSIITPFEAGWGRKGKERLTSPYINHIAYMESLYDRMSKGQERVMVVGNGGLYSIMEINESLKRGFDLLLLQGSGRFAEVAATLVANFDEIDLNAADDVIDAKVLAIATRELLSDVLEEWERKDFGSNVPPEHENALVYRIYFREFLKLAAQKKEHIRITNLETLEGDLEKVMKKVA